MKATLFFSATILSSLALACPNFSGTYKVSAIQGDLIRIEQGGCASSLVSAIDSGGNVIAVRTDYYDGNVRNSPWVPGELDSRDWSGSSLHSNYYLKDDGTSIDSVISQMPNEDLLEIQNQFQGPNKKIVRILWERQ